MDFLRQEIIFGLNLRHIAMIVLALMILSSAFKKLFGGKVSKKLVKKKCRGCTWAGPAGHETKRCPKCRGPLIEVHD